jgi:transposase-like protein
MTENGNIVAPEGQVWVCAACGKQSKDKYGYQKISRGWDESCMLNSVLCYDKQRILEGQTEPCWVAAINDLPDSEG